MFRDMSITMKDVERYNEASARPCGKRDSPLKAKLSGRKDSVACWLALDDIIHLMTCLYIYIVKKKNMCCTQNIDVNSDDAVYQKKHCLAKQQLHA